MGPCPRQQRGSHSAQPLALGWRPEPPLTRVFGLGEMPEGLPFLLGYSTSKSHWVLILDAWHFLSKGSLEQQHPALRTCSPGLA